MIINHLIFKVTNGYIKIFTRIKPIEIFKDKIEKETEIKSIFLDYSKEKSD